MAAKKRAIVPAKPGGLRVPLRTGSKANANQAPVETATNESEDPKMKDAQAPKKTTTKEKSNVAATKKGAPAVTKKASPAKPKATKAVKKADPKMNEEPAEEPKRVSRKRKADESAETAPTTTNKRQKNVSPVGSGKAAASKKAVTAKKAAPAKKGSTKSKATKDAKKPNESDTEGNVEKASPVSKKRKTAESAPKPTATKRPRKAHPVLNSIPQQVMTVAAFGTGDNCELGFGWKGKANKAIRPRINPLLAPGVVEVVQIASGGMHTAVLTKSGKVLTWGSNDHGELGRETKSDDVYESLDTSEKTTPDDSSEDDDPDTNLNHSESTPTEVTGFPEGTVVTCVAASDSATVAVTDTGLVYQCGTFRDPNGVLGLSLTVKSSPVMIPVPELKYIVKAIGGADHFLALDKNGKVWTWGAGHTLQLGRKTIDRYKQNSMIPGSLGLKKVQKIFSGLYHSFALDDKGRLFGWGLNQYSQTGLPNHGSEDSAFIINPTLLPFFEDLEVAHVGAGEHHSVAALKNGDIWVWGRMDAGQLGIDMQNPPPNTLMYVNSAGIESGPKCCPDPQKVESLNGMIKSIDCGTSHTLAITKDGILYSWGFNETYCCGIGPNRKSEQRHEAIVEFPTEVNNSVTDGRVILAAQGGGQYSVIGGEPRAAELDPSFGKE